MKSEFKVFIPIGAVSFPLLIVLNTVLFARYLAPQEAFFLNLAASVIVSWLLILTLYYVWAIYFYNINRGWTDKDWEDRDSKVLLEGEAREPENNPNSEQTLGLPPGTVRGTIALSLTISGLAMLIASFSKPDRLAQNEFLVDHFEFLKTGFLMMIAFYFGAKSLDFLGKQNMVKGTGEKGIGDRTTPPTPQPQAIDAADEVPPRGEFFNPNAVG